MLVYMTFHGHSVFDDRLPLNRQPLPLRRFKKKTLKLLLCIMATTRQEPEEQQTTKILSRSTLNTSPEEQTVAYHL